ncbi:MAG: DNA topoisomerase IV subunit B [Actinomycetia bacterium]|nr:DNA topoisomerase IV subunit B [Actinomycetes bacterium]MCP5032125.1 DNA topoisomerase IV subunit B [Actinomycetes bacterium]
MTSTPAKKRAKSTTQRKAAKVTSKSRKASTSSNYDASKIQILEGLEAVRKRPGMYIGGTGSEGLHHLVWEIIDNSVDEAAAGFASHVDIVLNKDGSIEVSDNGRGIPIDRKADGRTGLEVVFTELHAGGKFGSGAYLSSGGLHGVGASVVNALSTKLVAEVDRDGAVWRLVFLDREPGNYLSSGKFKPSSKLAKVKKIPAKRTGTRVRFWPDLDVFDAEARLDYELIRDHVARVCFLVPGLQVKLHDKRRSGSEAETFVANGGLADYVSYLSIGEPVTDIVTIHDETTFEEKVPIDGKVTAVTRPCTIDIAARWVKGYDTTIVSFVNTIPTRDGGTHVAGFERALSWVANEDLLADVKKLKKLAKQGKDRAVPNDIQEGLVAAVKVTFPEPQFKGQTKQELGTPAIQTLVYDTVKSGMGDWVAGGGKKSQINALREKIAQAVLTRVATKQQLDARRKAANLSSGSMPDKLADCRVHGADSELLIVEGNSAAGPAKQGRDSSTMAVLPLRGKVVNAGKATLKQVIENTEAQALITAIGAGSGRDFDISASRYGRIIILCDADVDGSHIRCLLLTLIYHHMRPLLEHGHVYAAQPPLFAAKHRGEMVYAFDDAERAKLSDELNLGLEKWKRFKGLGEMNVEELAETTLNRETRVLKRMTMTDGEEAVKAAKLFSVLMGNDVATRRAYIIRNSGLIDTNLLDI